MADQQRRDGFPGVSRSAPVSSVCGHGTADHLLLVIAEADQ